jgi:cytochrome c-type biogenesis protein CcmH/NrfG
LIRTADAEAAKGSLDKAADTLERALRMEGDNPDLWMKLAKINEQQGKHDQALGMVSKAQAYREQLN